MKIKTMVVRRIRIPFRVGFAHFLKSSSEVESVIVELHTSDGVVGYGECVPRAYVTGETQNSVIDFLLSRIAPSLAAASFDSLDAIRAYLDSTWSGFEGNSCARACIDLALLDAFGKKRKTWIGDLIGPASRRDRIRYSMVITAGHPWVVKPLLKRAAALEFTHAKLKVGRDSARDLKNLAASRKILGPDVDLRVDANGAWTLTDAMAKIPRFLAHGITSFEQPLPKSERDAYPELARFASEAGAWINLDESLCTRSDAEWMIRNRGATRFNLRVSKNGGVLETLALHRLARRGGISCQLGSQVGETSILTAAGQIVAAVAGDFAYHEGAFGTHLLKNDVCESPIEFGRYGWAAIRKGPGLGVEVDLARLATITRERRCAGFS